jgi:hypothetical protein
MADAKSHPQVKVDDPRAADLLLEQLRGKARGRTELIKVTRADAVALTGMPSEQAEPALKSLVHTYRSHLAVTDDGELVYEFDPSLERRDRVPLGERVRALGQVAWRGFQFLFKIWIVVTLVVYVMAFIAMMIAMMVARSSGSSDRDDRRGGGGFGIPWIWYWMMPDLAPMHDPYGRPLRRRNVGPKKRFYQSVFDFVFGPKQPAVDPREAEKRLVAFLRANKGRVTAAELVALSGMSLEAADEELTRLMVDYDGEVEVAEDGTLIYVFIDLLKSAGAVGTSWSYDWDRADPKPALTGNTPGTNAVVAGFAGFNLLASMTIGPAFLERFQLAGDPLAGFFVTLFPLLFSLVFFAVPGARLLAERRRERKRTVRRLRRALVKEIWAQPGVPLDPLAVATRAAERAQVGVAEARAALERLLVDLDGDVDTDADGRVRYVWKRLAEERASVEKVRAQAEEPKLGPVIFSSEDDRAVH